MATKESIKCVDHDRYFIQRVSNPGENNVVEYRTSTGGWSTDFENAMLWKSEEFAVSKAKELKANETKWHSLKDCKYSVWPVKVQLYPGKFCKIV